MFRSSAGLSCRYCPHTSEQIVMQYQLSVECFQIARHYSRCLGYSMEQNWQSLYSHGI